MIGLKRSTADAVLTAARRVDRPPAAPRPAGGAVVGQIPVLVVCTSATAANDQPEGEQCYPGVIIRGQAGRAEATPVGYCWLTVYDGVEGAAAVPALGTVYPALLGGVYDPDPDGDSDPRPRAFAAAAGAGDPPVLVYSGDGSPATGPADLTADFSVRPGAGTSGAASYWSLPAQAARSGVPGWVSIDSQTFTGAKTFEDDAVFEETIAVSGGWSGTFAGGDADDYFGPPQADVGGLLTADAVIIPGMIIGAPKSRGGSLYGTGIRFYGLADPPNVTGETVIDMSTRYSGVFASTDGIEGDTGRNLYVQAADNLNLETRAEQTDPGADPEYGLRINGEWTRPTNSIALPRPIAGVPGVGIGDQPVYPFTCGIQVQDPDGRDAVTAPARAAITCYTPYDVGGGTLSDNNWVHLQLPEDGDGLFAIRATIGTGGDPGGIAWDGFANHAAELLAAAGGISATLNFGGGGTGDVASITLANGIVTAYTTVP